MGNGGKVGKGEGGWEGTLASGSPGASGWVRSD